MPDEHLRRTAERAQNEVLRTRVLRVAEAVYPEWMLKASLFAALERTSIDTFLNEVDFNVQYLAEKGLLRREAVELEDDKQTWRVQLTARGVDFLEGRVEEIGLAFPDLVD